VGDGSVIVKSPEEYRAKAAESLREAEALPRGAAAQPYCRRATLAGIGDGSCEVNGKPLDEVTVAALGLQPGDDRALSLFSQFLPLSTLRDGAHAPARLMHPTTLSLIVIIVVFGAVAACLLGP
jgi:hypothetical protein